LAGNAQQQLVVLPIGLVEHQTWFPPEHSFPEQQQGLPPISCLACEPVEWMPSTSTDMRRARPWGYFADQWEADENSTQAIL